jgi:membrane-bound lytic murein transglycosylase B
MVGRRALLAAGAAAAGSGLGLGARAARAAAGGFDGFLASFSAEARRRGISQATLAEAFAHVAYNARVVQLDQHQPEFTLTWAQYRDRVVSQDRIRRGRALFAQHQGLLREVGDRYGVAPSIIMGIWGLESDYGRNTGGFNVIEALATLAYEGRRAAFFRSELMDALRILDHGDIPAAQMTGSFDGAMGQTQFMPDSFLKYAVDWSGTGRRDIWADFGCVFASTANYLAREGWQRGLPWGERVSAPDSISPYDVGREHRRPVAEWVQLGVRRPDGSVPPYHAAQAALLRPGGQGDEAYFAYYPSFLAVRRYNPSDFYDICVGLIGDLVTA